LGTTVTLHGKASAQFHGGQPVEEGILACMVYSCCACMPCSPYPRLFVRASSIAFCEERVAWGQSVSQLGKGQVHSALGVACLGIALGRDFCLLACMVCRALAFLVCLAPNLLLVVTDSRACDDQLTSLATFRASCFCSCWVVVSC
jgi:hypothetical protein